VRATRLAGVLAFPLVVVIGVLVAACAPAPDVAGPSLAVDCAAFEVEGANGAAVQRELDVDIGMAFVVTLCSNPSTGFGWEQPMWDGDAGIAFLERSVLQTVGGPPGEAGQERFVFRATDPGRATISFVYSQPWEGGKKGAWRLDVGVTVTPPGG
jgi:predicted secreted protein